MDKTGVPQARVLLEEMSWCEAAEILRRPEPVALLPVGSTEAHGPHLPLKTDALISLEVAQRAARELQRKGCAALVLPLVSYGVADCASSFSGTLTVKPETLARLVRDICLSAVDHGFRIICLCNCHLEPAHLEALNVGAAWVKEQTGVPVGIPDMREPEWSETLTEEFRKGSRHGGSFETSLVMSTRPDLAREEIRTGLEAVWIDLPGRIKAGAKTFQEAGLEMAYVGDPTQASVEEGEACFNALARMVVITVERLLQSKGN